MSPPSPTAPARLSPLLAAFFVSGCPALIYQLVWQRSLFTIYGVNVESITVVVAAFMLGLGLGSFAGGALSRLAGVSPLVVFAVLELGIGAFGLFSLDIFHAVGEATLGASTARTGLITFALVLVPTCLMGATLPLLVSWLVKRSGNVGKSLGLLYFVNTLGSAAACLLVAFVLMRTLGQQGTVTVAALLNFLVGTTALVLWRRTRGDTVATDDAAPEAGAAPLLAFPLALLLSGASGFVALSYEILWARVYGFASRGSAHSFSFLLGAYLIGIALGSHFAGKFCERAGAGERPVRVLGYLFLAGNAAALLLVPLVSYVVQVGRYGLTFPVVIALAAALGAVFPLVGHLSVAPDRLAGARVSYLYLSNIIGSTTGSLVTGFVLTDTWSIGTIGAFVGALGIGLGALVLLRVQRGARATVAAVVVLFVGYAAHHGVYERLQFDAQHKGAKPALRLIENRHGVIALGEDGTVYGGGVYDGVFSTDLVDDRNGVARPFSLAAFHAAPKRVLMIGLASGSWAQVVAHHPALESLTVVEINPGYVELIRDHPEVAGLLVNPKVTLAIDDGRRWLAANPERHFDAVVMNTTVHWRGHISNLLSVEFLGLVRARLAPGGVFLYNGTWSDEVYRTAATVFPHMYRYENCAVVSDAPLAPDRARWERILTTYRIEGRPVLDLANERHLARLDALLASLDRTGPPREKLETRAQVLERTAGLALVTDDNMVTEWLKIR